MTDTWPTLVALLWIGTLVVLVRQGWRGRPPVAGLTLAYWFQLFIVHGLAGAITLLAPEGQKDRSVSLIGFDVTGYAVVGILIGNFLAAYVFNPYRQDASLRPPATGFRSPAWFYILFGLSLYVLAGRVLPRIPGTDAVLASGTSLALCGFALAWYAEWAGGHRIRAFVTLASALLVPLLTLGLAGFLSYGVVFTASLACFVVVFYRPRWQIALVAPAIVFLGLSIFPTYMMIRTDIRRTESGSAARLEKMYLVLVNYQNFDLENKAQVDAIDMRLNQNILVGQAVKYLGAARAEFANGETLWTAMLAPIPRAIWADKPVYAGSGGLVSRFTGRRFAEGTSVGIGHVMELYVNFGAPGVLLGFVCLGLFLGVLDVRCGRLLLQGDARAFVLWYMVGTSLMHVQGNLAEIVGSIVGAIVLWVLVHSIIGYRNPSIAPTVIQSVQRVTL